jgi:hypothetical protein
MRHSREESDKADKEINETVSGARKRETSEKLVARSASASVQAAVRRAEEAAAEVQRLARQAAQDDARRAIIERTGEWRSKAGAPRQEGPVHSEKAQARLAAAVAHHEKSVAAETARREKAGQTAPRVWPGQTINTPADTTEALRRLRKTR